MSDWVAVGRVGKAHGLTGAFFVEDPSEDPDRFGVGAELFVEGATAKVVESKRARGRPVIRLDRDVPRGALLEVDRDGRVTDVQPGVANDVLELESGLLLPLVEACVRQVDLDSRRIVVEPGFDEAD